MTRGTGRAGAARLPAGLVTAGKTGTSSELRDSWFAGFSGDHLIVAWIGHDDNAPTGFTGSQAALPLWANAMGAIAQGSWQAPMPVVARGDHDRLPDRLRAGPVPAGNWRRRSRSWCRATRSSSTPRTAVRRSSTRSPIACATGGSGSRIEHERRPESARARCCCCWRPACRPRRRCAAIRRPTRRACWASSTKRAQVRDAAAGSASPPCLRSRDRPCSMASRSRMRATWPRAGA